MPLELTSSLRVQNAEELPCQACIYTNQNNVRFDHYDQIMCIGAASPKLKNEVNDHTIAS